jgi:hypothetical protein
MVFLMPSIIKIDHHHDHGEPANNSGYSYHKYHAKCLICSFEFSFFLSAEGEVFFEEEVHPKYYLNDYTSEHFENLSQFNFLLRAPPPIKD